MYHYDPKQALEELQEEGLLPHPVKLRDMILRYELDPNHAHELNKKFNKYLEEFGKLQQKGREILQELSSGQRKSA